MRGSFSMSKLSASINLVLEACLNNGAKQIKCGSLSAQSATQQLLVVLKQLTSSLNLDKNKYDFSISYGSGYFPKIPWVAITPKGKKASNSISVCICFAKFGEGIVCGAMLPKLNNNTGLKTKNRVGKNYIKLIATVGRSYNNKFLNPKDFYKDHISEKDLLEHIKESLKIINDHATKNV